MAGQTVAAKRLAMNLFRRTPKPVRRMAIHAGTPSYTAGVVMALTRGDGSLLLVEQRHTGGWALPGGLLDRGEPPSDGIVREVAEEIGLRLDPLRLPVPFAVLAPRARRVDVVFVCTADDNLEPHRVEDDVEVTGIGWFTLDALPDVTGPTLDILRGVRLL